MAATLPAAGDEDGRAYFSSARSTRHSPTANGSTTQIRVPTRSWDHYLPLMLSPLNNGCCEVPRSIHGWTSFRAVQIEVTMENAIGSTK